MSGLFQRLAGQALGTAPRVRAAASVRAAEPLGPPAPANEFDYSSAFGAAAEAHVGPLGELELESEHAVAPAFVVTDTATAPELPASQPVAPSRPASRPLARSGP